MICPKCKAEYVSGIYHCPDCNVQLADEIPSEAKIHHEVAVNDNFVSVYSPADSRECALIKMILDREKIDYFIKNDSLHGLGASIAPPFTSISRTELLVPADKTEQVLLILKSELGIK